VSTPDPGGVEETGCLTKERDMKRRTLDIVFSIGGLVLAALLLIVGLVLTSNANFAHNYVTTQLGEQNITFTAVDKLSDEEKKSACLVQYAGQKLTTGKQAECYANDYIGLHVKSVAGGKTYADLGAPQSALRTQVANAQKNNDPNLANLQKQLADVTAQRETLFKGETLRGLLLSSYGFSVFGDKAGQAALVAYLAAALLALLSTAGFAHALVTPKNRTFAAPVATEVATKKATVKV
jgi:methionine-rich copper-binding protein CopC